MGSLTWLFFSFEGRINRAIWWGVYLGLACISTAVTLMQGESSNMIFAVVNLVLAGLQIAPGVKRLHDSDKNPQLLWLYYGVPALLTVLALVLAIPAAFAVVLLFAALGVALWGIIDLGATPGTHGENRHGPDPLEGKRRPPGPPRGPNRI